MDVTALQLEGGAEESLQRQASDTHDDPTVVVRSVG